MYTAYGDESDPGPFPVPLDAPDVPPADGEVVQDLLQNAALVLGQGRPENVPAAQRAFAHRARMNALASQGQWRPDLDLAA